MSAKDYKEIVSAGPGYYTAKLPEIGDDIYIDSGDDRAGGLAKICNIVHTNGRPELGTFVCVEELPGTYLNWDSLAGKQAELREEFGDKRAHLYYF